ncbi:MAG: chemotaxis protein CheW [Proteobacteria bacterium]|nr:chemotaxis protein CheW [Pseudomonadota bacterium]
MIMLFTDERYVHLNVHEHQFCINVEQIQDVLQTPTLTYIPLSKNYICGLMNLRGRIVTAIDVGIKLGCESVLKENDKGMTIIVEKDNELYGLIFNQVGEVLTFNSSKIDKNLNTIDARWRQYASGICLLNEKIVVVLDVATLLTSPDS